MINHTHLPFVIATIGRLPYGNFSVPQLGLPFYAGFTSPAARGFGKQFYDSVSKHHLDTPVYRVNPVLGTKNPQIYEKTRKPISALEPTYPLETLLRDATVEQAMERVFEINFERLVRHYTIPFTPAAQEAL